VVSELHLDHWALLVETMNTAWPHVGDMGTAGVYSPRGQQLPIYSVNTTQAFFLFRAKHNSYVELGSNLDALISKTPC
jgi:hypothetical protein